jgi:hypothetical protein
VFRRQSNRRRENGRASKFRARKDAGPVGRTDARAQCVGVVRAAASVERRTLPASSRSGSVMEAARKQGRSGGRPPALDGQQKAIARKMKGAGVSMTAIAQTLGGARSTLYRTLD